MTLALVGSPLRELGWPLSTSIPSSLLRLWANVFLAVDILLAYIIKADATSLPCVLKKSLTSGGTCFNTALLWVGVTALNKSLLIDSSELN